VGNSMSTIKVDTINTRTGSGDITFSRPTVLTAGDIVEADIADNAITLAKMAGGVDGNIISYDASGDPVAVVTGSSGQVLTSAGAGAPPTFAAAAGGGAWNIIDTAVADDVASLTITGLDTSVYETFVIRCTNFIPITDGRSFRIRLGDSGGIDTGGTDYGHLYLVQQGGNIGPSGSGNNQSADAIIVDNYSGNASGENFSMTATLSCAAASLKPHLHFTTSSVNANGAAMTHHGVGNRTAAINVTQVQVFFSSGNISSGRMTVWGIAHA